MNFALQLTVHLNISVAIWIRTFEGGVSKEPKSGRLHTFNIGSKEKILQASLEMPLTSMLLGWYSKYSWLVRDTRSSSWVRRLDIMQNTTDRRPTQPFLEKSIFFQHAYKHQQAQRLMQVSLLNMVTPESGGSPYLPHIHTCIATFWAST